MTGPRKTLFAAALERRQGDEAALERLREYQRIHALEEDDAAWELMDLHEDYLALNAGQLWRFQAHNARRWESLKRLMWCVLGAVVLLFVTVVLVTQKLAYADGWENGYVVGHQQGEQTLSRKYDLEAAQWAISAEGRLARRLAQEDKGLLQWAGSEEARAMRRLGPDALVRATLRQQQLAVVPRDDAEWLTSQAGERARAASADGSVRWLVSEPGRLARKLSEDGTVDWWMSAPGHRARRASDSGELEWLQSDIGQWARAFSEDVSVRWLIQELHPYRNPDSGSVLPPMAAEEKTLWLGWLGLLLASGLLFDGDRPPPDQACETYQYMGHWWSRTADGRFCEVWNGRIFILME